MEPPSLQPSSPNRSKAKYWLAALVAVLVLGLGLGVAVGRYIVTPYPVLSPSPATGASPTISPSASPTRSSTASPGPAATTRYSDTTDRFSLRYPAGWVQRTCTVNGHATLFLAADQARLGACNSDFGGQISLTVTVGDQRSARRWTAASGYSNLVTQAVTAGGVSGQRQSAVVAEDPAVGPPRGSELVQYLFYANNRTYVASYIQEPASSSGVLAEFDNIITSTLSFTP